MYLGILLLSPLFATRALAPVLVLLAGPVIIAWGAGFWLYRKAPRSDAPTPPGNPIALLPALSFLVFVALAAIAPLPAAMAISGTIIANMAVKIGITLAYARRRGVCAAIAMISSVVALAAAIGVAWSML